MTLTKNQGHYHYIILNSLLLLFKVSALAFFNVEVICSFDMTSYPYDTQLCYVNMMADNWMEVDWTIKGTTKVKVTVTENVSQNYKNNSLKIQL